MSTLGRLGAAAQATLVLVVVCLVAGQAVGQPIGLGYVRTGSMAPTMQPGDGFVAVPAAVAGDVDEGDVIVFRAEELHGGGLTTHRVVRETDRGFVTKGDANPFTDQSDEEPPVKDAQVVAVALQVGGRVVVVPHLGDAVDAVRSATGVVQGTLASITGSRAFLGTRGLAYTFFGLSVAYYLLSAWRDRGRGTRSDERDTGREDGLDPRLLVAGMTLLLVGGATAPVVAGSGPEEYGVVSAEFGSSKPTVIPAGTSETVRYPVGNGGYLPTVSYVEPASEGVAVEPGRVAVGPRSVVNVSVTLRAPPETGYYRRFVVEHRYLAILPTSVVDTLYRLHPWLPVIATDLLLGVPFYLFGVSLVGAGNVKARRRDASRPGGGWL
jgi:signal peptidase